MKLILPILILFTCYRLLSAQSDTTVKYIFVPHPRSDNQNHQSVQPAIEKINFDLYRMILLGGDLTYYTSINRTSLDYCDSLFDLGSPNTLWTFGNHDVSNRTLIAEYTGRPDYYTYSFDNITFIVLDTELDANGFVSSHISGDQLEMVRQVCDTVVHSEYLVLLHHRLLWMIGDDFFSQKIDSVGESTRQLDTSNFNSVVFPLLQQVKNRGVRVLCLGGDKAKIIIQYSPEDSITYIASTMGPEFSDSVNHVVILSHDLMSRELTWEFVPLCNVEKNPVVVGLNPSVSVADNFIVSCDPVTGIVILSNNSETYGKGFYKVFNLSGQLLYAGSIGMHEQKEISLTQRGMYLLVLGDGRSVAIRKICVN
jgi:hypothetical protein